MEHIYEVKDCNNPGDDEGSKLEKVEKQQVEENTPERLVAHPSLLDPADNKRFISDRRQFLKQLPEEMWYKILTQLENPLDFENASNASLFLRSVVHEKKTERFFPKLWQIIGGQHQVGGSLKDPLNKKRRKVDRKNCTLLHFRSFFSNISLSPKPSKDSSKWCLSCIKVLVHDPYCDLLRFRLVCKTWNRTILENLFRCYPVPSNEIHDYFNRSWQYWRLPRLSMYTWKYMKQGPCTEAHQKRNAKLRALRVRGNARKRSGV